MALVYEKFEEQINGNYIEDTDLLTILAENIEKIDLVKDSIIYLDEFSGFTKQEYEVLKKFIKLAKQVNVTVCVDDLELNTNPDIDVFYSNKLTLSKIIDVVKSSNLKFEEPVKLENGYRFKTEELKHLSENMNNIKSTKYEKNVENMHLFLAKSGYSEIENVAKEIVKLIRKKNLRYKDIAIITKNIADYSSLVRVIFDKYNIPVFIDEKRDLNQNIIVQYILAVIEIINKNFSSDTIFNYLKIGFSKIDEDEIFKLENYCTKWGIKQGKWKKDFTYEIDKEEKKQEIQRLNELRKQIINPIIELKENIDKEKTAKNITKCLYEFMQNQNIENQISEKIKNLEADGLIDLANEYKTCYQIILSLFDEIVLVFGENKITINQYGQILKVGLKNSGLGKIPGTADQVTFGDVDRSRSHKVEAVFIIGLNDRYISKCK